MSNKFLNGYFKDSKSRPVYIDSNTKCQSSNVYLDKSMMAKAACGGIQKGEFIPKGLTYNEIFDLLINGGARKNPFTKLEKINDFLYYGEIDDVDYAYGREYIFDRYSDPNGAYMNFGACSSFRKGNFQGRNYDWYYDNQLEFIIRTKRSAKRYESIGLTSFAIEKDDIDINKFMHQYKFIPCHMLDGINEKGVCCNTNVCPFDKGKTTGTNPDLSEEATVSAALLIRLILDTCASADEAALMIKNDLNVVAPFNLNEEFHIMVSDINKTYIIEFINNKVNVLKPERPIMTNFHITDTKLNEDGSLIMSSVEPFGAGCERFNLINANWDFIVDADSAMEVLKKVKYTNAYGTSQNPRWKTEVTGDYHSQGFDLVLTTQDPIEKFQPVLDMMDQMFAERSRDTGKTWQSVHSMVFDIANKSFTICNQEDYSTKYTYSIGSN